MDTLNWIEEGIKREGLRNGERDKNEGDDVMPKKLAITDQKINQASLWFALCYS